MSFTVIAKEDINSGDPVMISNNLYVVLVQGDEEAAFISTGTYKKGDPIELIPHNGAFVDFTERWFSSDNPKTWPIFAPQNRRFWVWVRSLIYGFVRKIEDAYDLERPREKK